MNHNFEKNNFSEKDSMETLEKTETQEKALSERLQELSTELKSLNEYPFMDNKEVRERIFEVWQSYLSKEEIEKSKIKAFDGVDIYTEKGSPADEHVVNGIIHKIDAGIQSDLAEITSRAYRDIDYVEYMQEVSQFLEQQEILMEKNKPSLKIKLTDIKPNETQLGSHYAMFDRKLTLADYGPGGPTANSLGRLLNLAEDGVDLYPAIAQHEIIHHYQRVREKSPILRAIKMFKEKKKPSFKVLMEIHARLHDSLMGTGNDSEEKLLASLESASYNLSPENKNDARKAIICMKKLYALDVSNRRIANLIRNTKTIEDLSLFEDEINKEMIEKNIETKDLDMLVEIDNMQRNLVRLRTKKLAQEKLKERTNSY